MDHSDVFAARIRALQAIYEPAHRALINWGLWSRDRAGFQRGLTRSQIYNEYRWNDEEEGYADPSDYCQVIINPEAAQLPAKAERVVDDPYNERDGMILDERIHGSGGLEPSSRPVIRVVYVYRDVRESLYPTYTGLMPEAVVERLEAALRWTTRFS